VTSRRGRPAKAVKASEEALNKFFTSLPTLEKSADLFRERLLRNVVLDPRPCTWNPAHLNPVPLCVQPAAVTTFIVVPASKEIGGVRRIRFIPQADAEVEAETRYYRREHQS
jgi:hypothetical protein